MDQEQTKGEAAPRRDERAALTAAMDRHADGDAAAFAEVYDLLAPRLSAFFLRRTRDRARAEDLVQQTLLQMHCARATFVRGSDVIPWALAIGHRLFIDGQRRRKHEVLFDSAEDDGAALERRVDRASIPDEVAATRQMAARVDAELRRLPEIQRSAFQFVRDDGLSVAEAAEVMGTTSAAIKQRVYRVVQALRAVLGVGRGEGDGRKERGSDG